MGQHHFTDENVYTHVRDHEEASSARKREEGKGRAREDSQEPVVEDAMIRDFISRYVDERRARDQKREMSLVIDLGVARLRGRDPYITADFGGLIQKTTNPCAYFRSALWRVLSIDDGQMRWIGSLREKRGHETSLL